MVIYFNGQFISDHDPLISAQDRGLLLADGLFETFKIIERKPIYLREHLNRLFQSAKILSISHEISYEAIADVVDELITLNQFSDRILSGRLTLTRGTGPRGLLPPTECVPTVMLTVAPYEIHSERPIILCVAASRRNEYSIVSNLKTLSYTDNVLAKGQAQKQGADDAILLNTKGFVACTTCANIFIEKNNVLITPPVSDGILPGITRAKLIAESVLPVEERSITLSECRSADQIFITNALIGVRKVEKIL